jgi:hypothetical protein
MLYKSKAEQEAELWVTLPQAIAHICAAVNIKKRRARQELLKALADGAFRRRHRYLVRWKDEVRISAEGEADEIGPPDSPPRGQEWLRANISWASGTVLDPFGALVDGKWHPAWRQVLLYRSKVTELWRSSPPAQKSKASDLTDKRTRGPKTRKGISIVDAIRKDFKEGRLTIEKLRNMSDKELVINYGEKFDAKRTICREARKSVLTEFGGNSNAVE